MKTLERKQETRRKIQLGGLIKKAGLENEPTAILFGLLLEAAEYLQGEHAIHFREQWQIRADLVLTAEKLHNKNLK